jgi:hypothetical protein
VTVVLDAGALIALERNDRSMWAVLKLAARAGQDVLVPSTVVAQVWRRTPAQALLATALKQCVVSPFEGLARQVGELCGRARTADICDAHVAIVVATRGETLFTSDPDDLRRLIAAFGRGRPSIVAC